MRLDDLIRKFDEVKKKLDPIVERKRLVLPIFRVASGDNQGDGFFYGGKDRLSFKYGMSGHDEQANPDNLKEAYAFFGKRITISEALRLATRALDKNYE